MNMVQLKKIISIKDHLLEQGGGAINSRREILHKYMYMYACPNFTKDKMPLTKRDYWYLNIRNTLAAIGQFGLYKFFTVTKEWHDCYDRFCLGVK